MRDWLVFFRFNVSQERSSRPWIAYRTERRTNAARPRRRRPAKCTTGHRLLCVTFLPRSSDSWEAAVDRCARVQLRGRLNVRVFSVQPSVCDQDAMPVLLDRARDQRITGRAGEPVLSMVNI